MTPTLEDLARAIEALGETVEEVADGRDLDAKAIHDLRTNVDAMRHTVDDPANPRNLRDETTRSHSRLDGHDQQIRTMSTHEEGGRAAAIIRASRGTLREALTGDRLALAILLVGAPFVLVAVTVLILALTGQLDETAAALRGTPETEIAAPGSTVNAPDARINP